MGSYRARSRSAQSSLPALSAGCLPCRACLSLASPPEGGARWCLRGWGPKAAHMVLRLITWGLVRTHGAWNKTGSQCACGQLAALPRGPVSVEEESVASLTAVPPPRRSRGQPFEECGLPVCTPAGCRGGQPLPMRISSDAWVPGLASLGAEPPRVPLKVYLS